MVWHRPKYRLVILATAICCLMPGCGGQSEERAAARAVADALIAIKNADVRSLQPLMYTGSFDYWSFKASPRIARRVIATNASVDQLSKLSDADIRRSVRVVRANRELMESLMWLSSRRPSRPAIRRMEMRMVRYRLPIADMVSLAVRENGAWKLTAFPALTAEALKYRTYDEVIKHNAVVDWTQRPAKGRAPGQTTSSREQRAGGYVAHYPDLPREVRDVVGTVVLLAEARDPKEIQDWARSYGLSRDIQPLSSQDPKAEWTVIKYVCTSGANVWRVLLYAKAPVGPDDRRPWKLLLAGTSDLEGATTWKQVAVAMIDDKENALTFADLKGKIQARISIKSEIKLVKSRLRTVSDQGSKE